MWESNPSQTERTLCPVLGTPLNQVTSTPFKPKKFLCDDFALLSLEFQLSCTKGMVSARGAVGEHIHCVIYLSRSFPIFTASCSLGHSSAHALQS